MARVEIIFSDFDELDCNAVEKRSFFTSLSIDPATAMQPSAKGHALYDGTLTAIAQNIDQKLLERPTDETHLKLRTLTSPLMLPLTI